MIHVLHILNSAHGGSAISTFELIEALKKNGVKSSLVCFNNASQKQVESISRMVDGRALFIPLYWMNKRIRAAIWKRPFIEVKTALSTRYGHRYQRQIAQLIRQHGINVIHTSTILNPEGAIAAKRNRIPHVWHVRELVGPTKHFQFYNYLKWSKYIQANCKYLVANSIVTKECLEEFFPEEKIKCIPNGINCDEYEPKIHSNANEPLVVGMVGSVTTRWKNHEFFIRVAAAFNGQQHVSFRIYGSLPSGEDSYYKGLIDLAGKLGKGKPVVEFIPFKGADEIMKEIDVLFHPSEFESFGRIFIEAMAGGIPVVAVNEGGALEMVKNGINGFLIPLNDCKLAVEKLDELMNSAERRNQMGIKGRELVEELYSLQVLSERISSLYAEVQAKNDTRR